MKDIVNYTDKPLSEFTPNDTIYIVRNKNGYDIHYYCQFEKVEKGVVYGRIINATPDWAFHITQKGVPAACAVRKSYVFGKSDNENMNRCHWYDSKSKKFN